MFDKLKRILVPPINTGDEELKYRIAMANHLLSEKCKYRMFIDMLKEQGYLIDTNICLTEKDTEFIQTYDVTLTNRISNDTLMTLTVPGINSEVRLVSRGFDCSNSYSNTLIIEHYPKSDGFDNYFKIEIVKYNTSSQVFRHIDFVDINKTIIFDKNGLELTTGSKVIWKLRYLPIDPPTNFPHIDINIKKEFISYSGMWDICVYKDAQDKFPWWKYDKYVGSR